MAGCQGTQSNPYAAGNCTWWVKHLIGEALPGYWGNGAEWWANAQQCGWGEGQTPAVGAIAVWGPGVDPPDGFGHVAVVTAVNGGGFTVSEMNWQGLGKVDTRNVTSPDNLLGFIYPSGVSASGTDATTMASTTSTGGSSSGGPAWVIPGVSGVAGAFNGLVSDVEAGSFIWAGGFIVLAGLGVILFLILRPLAKDAIKVAGTVAEVVK